MLLQIIDKEDRTLADVSGKHVICLASLEELYNQILSLSAGI